MTMKKTLLAAALALGCAEGYLPETGECLEYRTVLEETFGKDDGWEFDDDYYPADCIQYHTGGCYTRSSPCNGDGGERFILSNVTKSLSKVFSISPGTRIDRMLLKGNAYGRDVGLELQIEDYQMITMEGLGEKEDCREIELASMNGEQHHSITEDGEFYLKIGLYYRGLGGNIVDACLPAPEQPECAYSRRRICYGEEETQESVSGCYGLSKIIFQQCGDTL